MQVTSSRSGSDPGIQEDISEDGIAEIEYRHTQAPGAVGDPICSGPMEEWQHDT